MPARKRKSGTKAPAKPAKRKSPRPQPAHSSKILKPVFISVADLPWIESYRSYFTKTAAEIAKTFGEDLQQLPDDYRYGVMNNLRMVENQDIIPGQFFLRDGELKMIYLEEGLDNVDFNGVTWNYGAPKGKNMLPARLGKPYSFVVYPEHGLSFSVDPQDRVERVEIFRPTTLRNYVGRFYQPKQFAL